MNHVQFILAKIKRRKTFHKILTLVSTLFSQVDTTKAIKICTVVPENWQYADQICILG